MLVNSTNSETTVLVIDSDILTLEFTVANLIKAGYKTLKAKTASEAYSSVESRAIDCIILNAEMNENNNLENLKDLRNVNGADTIPIILSFPKNYQEYKGILNFSNVDLVTKPLNYKELLFRIEKNIQLAKYRNAERKIIFDEDKLFSILAHDLKKPFASLLGMTQLLSESAQSCTKEEIKELTKENYKTVKSTYKLLNNMLEWYRILNGHVKIKPAEFDLSRVCSKVIFNSKNSAFNKKISLISQIDCDSFVYADEELIYMALSNLIENAIKFSPIKSRVIISGELNTEYRKLTVCDNGVGIDEENIHKLFKVDEIFTTPGTNNEKGCGFGLIIAKEIIEKSGGEFKVESQPGKGSKFSFSLPISKHSRIECN
jgi:signal transduction histidine kinase